LPARDGWDAAVINSSERRSEGFGRPLDNRGAVAGEAWPGSRGAQRPSPGAGLMRGINSIAKDDTPASAIVFKRGVVWPR